MWYTITRSPTPKRRQPGPACTICPDARDRCSGCPNRRWWTPSCEAAPRRDRAPGRAPPSERSCCYRGGMRLSLRLSLSDHPIQIPKIFPGLVLFPQKDLPFDEAAILVDAGDGRHIRIGERRADHALKIRQVVARVDGERDRRGAALFSPLHADHGPMHAETPGDGDDHGVLDEIGRAHV